MLNFSDLKFRHNIRTRPVLLRPISHINLIKWRFCPHDAERLNNNKFRIQKDAAAAHLHNRPGLPLPLILVPSRKMLELTREGAATVKQVLKKRIVQCIFTK